MIDSFTIDFAEFIYLKIFEKIFSLKTNAAFIFAVIYFINFLNSD